jgi:hypothetical protein
MQSFAYSKTYFELAKENVQKLLPSFTQDDHVFLYTNSMEKPVPVTKDNVQQRLKEISVANNVFNLAKSLSVADSVFKENLNLNNELYLISDFRIQSANVDSVLFKGLNNLRVYKIQIAKDIPFKNVSVDTVIINSQLFEINKPFDISVKLTNHDQEKVETNINLFNNQERVSMEFASLEANESKPFNIKYIPKSDGIHLLSLQLEEDDLSFDNNWYFSFYMRNEIKTLFISDHTTDAMQTALKILSQSTVFNITQLGFKQWPGTNLFNYDLIILNDFKTFNINDIDKLKSFMELKRSVIIIPGSSANIEDYNAFFNSMINHNLFDRIMDSGQDGYFSLENQKTANAIFNSLFRDKKSSFNAPRVYKYYKQSHYDHALIHLSNRDPFITQTKGLIVFSASFNSDWSDMEINGLFLPLLYRSFYHASQNKTPVSDMLNVGDDVIFTEQGTTIDKNYYIQNTAGKKFAVIPKPLNNNLIFNAGQAQDAGFYILENETNPVAVKAINHSARELKKPYMDESDLTFKLVTLDDKDFLEQIQDARLGFELWIFCLILAFLMILAEMILIKKIEGTPFLKKV